VLCDGHGVVQQTGTLYDLRLRWRCGCVLCHGSRIALAVDGAFTGVPGAHVVAAGNRRPSGAARGPSRQFRFRRRREMVAVAWVA
jgi:hypothetical protein